MYSIIKQLKEQRDYLLTILDSLNRTNLEIARKDEEQKINRDNINKSIDNIEEVINLISLQIQIVTNYYKESQEDKKKR